MWAERLLLPCRARLRLLPPRRWRRGEAGAMRLQTPQFQALFTPGLRSVAGGGAPRGRAGGRGLGWAGMGWTRHGAAEGPGRSCAGPRGPAERHRGGHGVQVRGAGVQVWGAGSTGVLPPCGLLSPPASWRSTLMCSLVEMHQEGVSDMTGKTHVGAQLCT